MKILAAAVLLAVVSCHSVDTSKPDGTLKHRILAEGAYGRTEGSHRQSAYATDDAAYKAMWSAVVGSGDPPAVDFTREAVVFIAAGQRPTGGYAIQVKGVRRDGDAVVVDAPITSPPPDAMSAQVITSPFAVLAVDKGAARVKWDDAVDMGKADR